VNLTFEITKERNSVWKVEDSESMSDSDDAPRLREKKKTKS
jgi:hypothetical protein